LATQCCYYARVCVCVCVCVSNHCLLDRILTTEHCNFRCTDSLCYDTINNVKSQYIFKNYWEHTKNVNLFSHTHKKRLFILKFISRAHLKQQKSTKVLYIHNHKVNNNKGDKTQLSNGNISQRI